MCPLFTCPVYVMKKKALKVFIHTQFTRQMLSLRSLSLSSNGDAAGEVCDCFVSY